MPDLSAKPDEAMLRKYLLGELSEIESQNIERFLESSPDRVPMPSLPADDTLLSAIRGQSAETPQDSAKIQKVMNWIERVGNNADLNSRTIDTSDLSAVEMIDDSTNEVLSLLGPVEGQDGMGMLGGYRVIRVLGRGGMGVVLDAEDARLGRHVALKAMRPTIATNPLSKQRFLREAKAAAKVEHDHIVPIYQIGEDRGILFLAMPFLKGEPLDTKLKREGRLSPLDVVRIGRQTAEGLAAAHDAGLIHRDIKPGNLWIESPSQRVKILDFGLARAAGADDVQLTTTGTVVGTPAYMAPEQAGGKVLDGRCDLFSLGVVLYRASTGELPFKGDSAIEIIHSLALHTPTHPSLLNPEVPKALGDIIEALLVKDPTQRIASAREVAKRLAAIERDLNNDTIPIDLASAQLPEAVAFADTTESILPRAAADRPSSRKKLWIACGLLGLAAAIAVAVVVIIRDKSGKEIARVTVPKGGSFETREESDPPEKNPKEPIAEVKGKDQPGIVKPELPPVVADKEKPFVLIRGGKVVGEYANFTAVWSEVGSGDVIEVHGNGPFPMGKVDLAGQKLTLKAGPGYRPRFVPHESVWDGGNGTWLRLKDAVLTVEGCDFVGNPPIAKQGLHFLDSTGGTSCFLRRCRVLNVVALGNFEGSTMEITDSLMSCGYLVTISAKCKVLLRNNILIGGHEGILLLAPGGQTVQLENNTFWTIGVVQISSQAKGIVVKATGNIFGCRAYDYGQRLPVLVRDDPAVDWRTQVQWEGRQNRYRGLWPDVRNAPPAWWPKEKSGLAAWNKFLPKPEEGSLEIGADGVGFAYLKPHTFDAAGYTAYMHSVVTDARKQSGIADLGPDFNLLGPGAAYLRALADAGKSVPKDQLRPEPEIGGAVVLLRSGKVLRSFQTIAAAVEQVKDGDIVELRADKTFEGFHLPGDRGTVTVRAAPGYLPIIGPTPTVSGIAVYPGTALILEGICCRDINLGSAGDEPRKWGRIVRLANCTFERDEPKGGAIEGIFGTLDGKSAEIVNCCIRGGTEISVPGNSRVEVRNSVFKSFWWRSMFAGKAELAIDRCAFWNLGEFLSNGLHVVSQGQKEEIAITARRSLFDPSGQLLYFSAEFGKLKWLGSRNLYRLLNWSTLGDDVSLAGWRKRTGSPEEGSVEADALLTDPLAWKLLPGSVGQGAGPEGKDLGADVTRVAAGETAKAKLSPDREKPFVLLRQGKPAGEFKTYIGILGELKEGDVIQVYGNGPIELPRINLDGIGLSIKAAPGYRPRFVPAASVNPVGSPWINVDKASVRLEGCDFFAQGAQTPLNFLFSTGSCEITRCRLVKGDSNSDVFLYLGGTPNRISDSLLVGGFSHHSIFFGPKTETDFENNIYWNASYNFFILKEPGEQVLRLKANTFYGGGNLFHISPKFTGVCRIEAERNLYLSWQASLLVAYDRTLKDLKEVLHWQGRNNVYSSGSGQYAYLTAGKETLTNLADWSKYWGKQDEGTAEAKGMWLQWEAPHRAPTPTAGLETVRRMIETARPGFRVDWDLMGPGEAYVKALEKSTGKPIPKNELRPEQVEGGPVALMRNGKGIGGFPNLAEATAAAVDDDVISIRTDREVSAVNRLGQKGKSLRIVAGPGYLPIIVGQLILAKDDVWTIEGLHFRDVLNPPPLTEVGQVSRLANCSFDWLDNPLTGSLAITGNGKGARLEIVNCIIPQTTQIYVLPPQQTLHIENSLLGYVMAEATVAGVGERHLELDRCVFWTPAQLSALFWIRSKAATIGIKATNCWFECNCLWNGYGSGEPRQDAFRWSGNRNVFRIGTKEWILPVPNDKIPPRQLEEFRKFWNSDADSVALDPLHFDPLQWKLLPGVPGQGKGPNGKDLGADVTKVAPLVPGKQ